MTVRDIVVATVAELNDTGGINGHPLELIVRDDGSETDPAVTAVQGLIDDGAVGIIGVVDDKVSGMELGKGLKILPPLDAIARYLPELKRQTAFIVLLAFTDEERMKEIAERYIPSMKVNTVFVGDRLGRGGDHTPFQWEGFAAIRVWPKRRWWP